ncbi:MAG: hypothetical protein CM15mP87_08430 [Candidatus Neomarinimicrobiota bacterium]|nr:MAG: hypothetical protein CM15mP87_08430 [Candidatus Neomarinimicrobiota bacterium]
MSNNSDHSIEHHIQTYIRVFIALGVLTVITVAVSYLEVSFIEAFFLAITIASIKGSLVLGFFMHLISERAAIIWILGRNHCRIYHPNVYPINIINRLNRNVLK